MGHKHKIKETADEREDRLNAEFRVGFRSPEQRAYWRKEATSGAWNCFPAEFARRMTLAYLDLLEAADAIGRDAARMPPDLLDSHQGKTEDPYWLMVPRENVEALCATFGDETLTREALTRVTEDET